MHRLKTKSGSCTIIYGIAHHEIHGFGISIFAAAGGATLERRHSSKLLPGADQ